MTRLINFDCISAGFQQARERVARHEVDGCAGQTRRLEQSVDVSQDVIQTTFAAVMCHDTVHLTTAHNRRAP